MSLGERRATACIESGRTGQWHRGLEERQGEGPTLQRQTTSKDVAAIFVAGHGTNAPNGYYYFLPANVDLERLKSTGVAFSEFTNTVAALAGKVLFFLDTCHSGNVMKEK